MSVEHRADNEEKCGFSVRRPGDGFSGPRKNTLDFNGFIKTKSANETMQKSVCQAHKGVPLQRGHFMHPIDEAQIADPNMVRVSTLNQMPTRQLKTYLLFASSVEAVTLRLENHSQDQVLGMSPQDVELQR